MPATWRTVNATAGGLFGGGSSWYNQELPDFTRGVYDAREKAMGYASAQAAQLNAHGLIGVRIDEHASTRRVNRGGIECDDLIVSFHVLGTAVREEPALAGAVAQAQPTRMMLSLA